MESPSAYIPMDRRRAIARRESLPTRTQGSALFADISGFTPLTEALLKEYGQRRGPEELTHQLNLIYDALVVEVHRYGGSVLAFSGDAVTCWFDADDGLRAIACGLAMQRAMGRLAGLKTPSGKKITLAMKAAVAAGPVRRFQIGDPDIHYVDALAGATLDRMAAAEHHAEQGEVVVDSVVYGQVGPKIEIREWRDEPAINQRFGVVAGILEPHRTEMESVPRVTVPPDALRWAETRSWLLPPVFDRLQAGRGEFLTELRPAVALFLAFSGIDYDDEEAAGDKLDAYVCWVQRILARYEGYLLQLTIGDKGSYLYTAFGAPVAHEDDSIRAVSAAVELLRLPAELAYITDVKIGISQGQMRTGAYGGVMRRTYGVLGDEVNMSARLMQAARPGQILVKDTVWHNTGDTFVGQQLPPFAVKGKTEPVTAYNVTDLKVLPAVQLRQPKYTLPMVGRQAELQLIKQKMDQAQAGHGQVVAIIAEAGMGKSRLVAEAIRLAAQSPFTGYGGECQSYGTTTSYLVWQPIWRAFFNLDPAQSESDQINQLEAQLTQINSAFLDRLPLLGPVLNLSIPDNDLTRSFDAKLRKTSLESLLVDCLRVRARLSPILLVLEDCHWLDPLSHDLLEIVGRAIADLPVLMVLAYRPLQLERLKEARVEKLPYFTGISLTDFSPEEAERLIGLKLVQLFGEQVDVPAALIKLILQRAQGNPFFIEELINYLQDHNVDLHRVKTVDQLDLPGSLHSLILSRIDKLTESQKSTIKVASVIGRLFEAGWLWGMYPELGQPDQIKGDLEVISRLELTPLDKPDPELSYIFKHVVTQEVAYESLPYAMRAILHDQLAQFIERKYSDQLERYLFLLAYHYSLTQNTAKQIEYLRRAGELAQAEYSNEAALDYFRRLLPLLSAEERVPVLVRSGDVLTLSGHYEDALTYYAAARFLLENSEHSRPQQLAELCRKSATVYHRLSEYEVALEWLDKGLSYLDKSEPTIEAARIYNITTLIYRHQGKNEDALDWCQKSLDTTSQIKSRQGQQALAHTYFNMGAIYWRRGDLTEAIYYCRESVQLFQQLEDIVGLSDAYLNLSNVYADQGDWDQAGDALREGLALKHKLGDVYGQGMMANNLGYIHLDRGEWTEAASLFEQYRDICQQIGATRDEANALSNLAQVRIYQKNWEQARTALSRSQALFAEIGSEEFLPELERRWGEYYLKTGDLDEALAHTRRSIDLAVAQEARLEEGMSYRVLGQVYLSQGEPEQAKSTLQQSLQILTDLNSEYEAAKTIVPMVSLALNRGPTATDRERLAQAIETFKDIGARADLIEAQALAKQLGRAGRKD